MQPQPILRNRTRAWARCAATLQRGRNTTARQSWRQCALTCAAGGAPLCSTTLGTSKGQETTVRSLAPDKASFNVTSRSQPLMLQ